MIINLTPHTLDIHLGDGDICHVAPSGSVARVASERTLVGIREDLPIYSVTFGEIEGLPKPNVGDIFIVSGLVAARSLNRRDVFSPGELLRDSSGRPVGCQGLTCS